MTIPRHLAALALLLPLCLAPSPPSWADIPPRPRQAPDETPPPKDARTKAPRFKGKDLRGRELKLADFEGRVVVVAFWATWCGPCKQELTVLQRLYKQLEPAGLTVIAVATDGPETVAQVRANVRRYGWTFPVLLDTDGAVAAQLNPRVSVPFSVFLDRDHGVAWQREGFTSADATRIERWIRALLAEPRGAPAE